MIFEYFFEEKAKRAKGQSWKNQGGAQIVCASRIPPTQLVLGENLVGAPRAKGLASQRVIVVYFLSQAMHKFWLRGKRLESCLLCTKFISLWHRVIVGSFLVA